MSSRRGYILILPGSEASVLVPGIGRLARFRYSAASRRRSIRSITAAREGQVDEQQREYLKVPEVVEVLRIARSRAYELIGSGEIPSIRIGRSVRVGREELDRWLEEQRQPGAGWRYSKRSMIASWCRP